MLKNEDNKRAHIFLSNLFKHQKQSNYSIALNVKITVTLAMIFLKQMITILIPPVLDKRTLLWRHF